MKFCTKHFTDLEYPYAHTHLDDDYTTDLRLQPESNEDFRLLIKISKFLDFTMFIGMRNKIYYPRDVTYENLKEMHEKVQSNRQSRV